MNERQAVKFWNSIAQGELLHVIPDSDRLQGGPVFKDTYSSTICDQFYPFLDLIIIFLASWLAPCARTHPKLKRWLIF